jgi:(p)ppGpp synthase/HD superfamily hydrolase
MVLTARFEDAFRYACIAHAGQVRKGTAIPYVSHLIAVASLVLEHGGDEDAAIAGLLHDAAEDAGGELRLEDIRGRYGEMVASAVKGCTDTMETPKPAWRQRKEMYHRHLETAAPTTLLVSCCDKLHNARSIVNNLRVQGEELWKKFNGGKEGTLWYYETLAGIFSQLDVPPALSVELGETVKTMRRLAD